MSEKRKCTSSTAIQVKNLGKIIGNKDKLDVISRLEKGERFVDIRRNVKFACISVRKIYDNAEGSKENVKSGTKVLCSKTTTVVSERT